MSEWVDRVYNNEEPTPEELADIDFPEINIDMVTAEELQREARQIARINFTTARSDINPINAQVAATFPIPPIRRRITNVLFVDF